MPRRTRITLAQSALFAALFALPFGADAAPPRERATITLLRPPAPDPQLSETLARVEGELSADGFRVSTFELGHQPSKLELASLAAEHPGSLALVTLIGPTQETALELWVVDQRSGRMLMTRIELSSPAGPTELAAALPEVLSRRAVEMLRATLLELSLSPDATLPEAAPKPLKLVAAPKKRASLVPKLRWGGELGAAALGSTDVSFAALPLLRARIWLGQLVSFRLTGAALGSASRVAGDVGSAEVSQQLALLEVMTYLVGPGRVRPTFGLGGGVLRVSAAGAAAGPYRVSQAEAWSFVADAGVGLSFELSSDWAVAAEAHALLQTPSPVIRFLGEEVARLGRPSLMASLTLVGRR